MEKIRIQKFFTDCGIMSRRAAEREVAAGRVRVNGEPCEIGQKIDPNHDIIEYGGRAIKYPRTRENIYVMLNKPRGYLSAVSDDRGRRCVTELVTGCPGRIYPIGRLDMNSEGLLLLTDDGNLAHRLTHPKHEIPKIYHVTLRGEAQDSALAALAGQTELDGYRLAPVGVGLLFRGGGETIIEMTLYEGRNRQIRKMCEAAGLVLTRLCRVAIGELKLSSLPPGRWRVLSENEVDYLYGRKNSL